MTSLVSASQVVTGQVQSLDSVRAHALPSDAMIFASATKVQPANQNLGSFSLVESANALTLTTTGSVPVVTQSPFADLYKEGSIYFSGSGSNYITASAAGLVGTQWNTTGLTVEAWVNYPTFTGAASGSGTTWYPNLVGSFHPTINYLNWGFGANTTGYVTFYYWNGSTGPNINATVPLSTNTWNHIAFSCVPGGATANVYVNGVSVASTSISGTPTTTSSALLTLGQNNNNLGLNCYVADVRITTGAALYTGSSFTVPSAPLSPAATGVAQALIRAGQNSPTVQNGALTFDRGLRQFQNYGPMTFNIVTQGFTAVWRGAFTGTVASYERLFEFGTDATNGYMAALRLATGSSIYFFICPSNSTSAQSIYLTTTIVQGTTYVFTFRYNPVTQILDAWTNGVQVASSPVTTSTLVADRILSPVVVGGYNSQGTTSMTSNTLAIYNRALSNVEILNAYSALTTNTVNAPIEIGDSNGTPALSIAGDGRVNVTKMGQTSNVLPWPPAAMTGYVTSINGGTYVASSSNDSVTYNFTYSAFDKSNSTYWSPLNGTYTGGVPYSGAVTTTDVNGTQYRGEWLQLQLPSQIYQSYYTIYAVSYNNAPTAWAILGSNDGVNWFLVDTRTGVSWAATPITQTFTLSTPSTKSYSYFRMVVNMSGTVAQGVGVYSVVYELTYYGTADTAQPLTVSQPVTLSYGAQTASLTGIANAGVYVPQDFSSSGLNIPAYVVSNTATVANTVQYSSFGPFAGEGSLYFPGGTGSYVNFGTQLPVWPSSTITDATFEAWIYLTVNSGYNPIFSRVTSLTSGTYDWRMYIDQYNRLYMDMYNSGKGSSASIGQGSPVLSLNTWTHVAWVVRSGVSYVFINGGASGASATLTSVNYTSSALTTVGQWNNTAGNTFNGYIASARIVSGAALYTTNFQVPSGPLQPIQGVTQAGLPYGTVLLLRNAPAPGRVLTSKFGGANSGGVLAFPPAAMTGYSTALSSGYGQGVYVASASAEFSGTYAYNAFDKNTGTTWGGQSGQYTGSGSFPYLYVGGSPPKTVDVNGNAYTGDWVQIQMPSPIILSSYSIYYNTSYACPGLFYILGSRDGTNWSLVDQRTQAPPSSSGYITFSVSSSQAFTYFRLQAYGVTTTGGTLNVLELVLNGSIEGAVNITADGRLGVGVSAPVQALEVAGSAVVAGTLSAGNPLMFRNRIINGDFRVDQRGSASSVPTSGYGPDRWQLSSSSSGQSFKRYTLVTASDDVVMKLGYRFGVQINRGTGGLVDIVQPIELGNCSDMFSQPMMLSFWGRSSTAADFTMYMGFSATGTSSMTFNSGTVYSLTTNWQYITIPVPVPPIFSTSTDPSAYGIQLTLRAGSGAPNSSIQYYTGVQLEKGSVATPFEVRPYATELQLCQRYYQRFQPSISGGQRYIATGCIMGANTAGAIIALPVGLRSNLVTMYNNSGGSAAFGSALTIGSSELYFYNGSTNFIPTTVTLSSVSTSSAEASASLIYLAFGGGSGGTAGGASMLLVSGANAFFAFGAEL
jgi:hypothetical protein